MNTQLQDLSTCPVAIRAIDSNAERLWRIFLKKAGIPMAGSKVIEGDGSLEHETKRAHIVRNFGVPSLMQRLAVAYDERSRAKVWWRECIACSDGGSDIPDLTAEYVLNPFIVTKELKYPNPRLIAMAAARENTDSTTLPTRGRPAKSVAQKRAANAARSRRFRAARRTAKNTATVTV
jgi:hypothetical protein